MYQISAFCELLGGIFKIMAQIELDKMENAVHDANKL